MSVKGDVSILTKLSQKLQALPRDLAKRVAAKAAPKFTALAKQSFAAGQSPDGEAWASGVDGKRVDLRESGALENSIRYVAVGEMIQGSVGTSYAKYQVGKRPVLPADDLPSDYSNVLDGIIQDEAKAFVAGGR